MEHSWASWGQADEESVFSEILIMFTVLKCWFVPFCFWLRYHTVLYFWVSIILWSRVPFPHLPPSSGRSGGGNPTPTLCMNQLFSLMGKLGKD